MFTYVRVASALSALTSHTARHNNAPTDESSTITKHFHVRAHTRTQIEEDLSIDEEPDEEPEGDYSSLRIIENERRDTNERPAPPLLTSPQNSRARHQSRVAVKGECV